MSVIFDESNYQKVRMNDPSYQSMIRISDVNNVYDIRQEYVKTGTTRNDFQTQLDKFNNNSGVLNDGKYIDMSNFFIDTERVVTNGVTSVVGKNIPYFKFKTNHVLNFYNNAHIKDTYIDKTKVESIYDLIETSTGDKTTYSLSEDKKLTENVYNSYPLQRVDRLVIHELDSLFVYIDGRKIPDNKVFVYANRSFTDVFIPQEYIPDDITNKDSIIDTVFNIDYRQPGSEGFYFLDRLSGNSVSIDLTDPKYQYKYHKNKNMQITVDKLLIFINGYVVRAKTCTINGTILNITFDRNLDNAEVEIYILNNLIYRYKVPESSMLNNNGSKVHFYINDDFVTDTLAGPITKNAISFWYNGKRIDDSKITQTSRFSFKYETDLFTYTKVDIPTNMRAEEGVSYYIKNKNNEYVYVGQLQYFEYDTIYFTRDLQPTFDESLIDFVIEDINSKIDDKLFATYGDDYYLLNMLGVRRCVDRMKGTKSYSVLDDPKYQLNFEEILSNNGKLFDVQTSINKYNQIIANSRTPNDRIKALISSRPTLLRKLLEQVKSPFKRFVVIGNENDVNLSSVEKFDSVKGNAYYKVYVNHMLINTNEYIIVRDGDHDIITIPKEKFKPVVQNEDGSLKSGRNTVELYQYDMTYKEKIIFKDNIKDGYTKLINPDGSYRYRKTYLLSNLPFGLEVSATDLCGIERVERKWFDYSQIEYNYIYPTEDFVGYRMVKYFNVVNMTETEITIDVELFDTDPLHTNGEFFIIVKQYNVAEQFRFSNEDKSYMESNDLMIPIYSTYTEYEFVNGQKRVKSINKYIPYINTSEPIITCEGKELIYGKDYTYFNPETNDNLTSSYIVLKSQLQEDAIITVQFNSNKTNVLIVGYDDLNIDNRYGLLYLSELKYPFSTEYMNVFINGEKLSAYDIDILSDKLIRVHHITRPIKSVLITTNSLYETSELQEFIDLYHESDFEKTLEDIFWNCDPSKMLDANKQNIDYIYKVNPYYPEFVGDKGENYENPYYMDYINRIYERQNTYLESDVFSKLFAPPVEGENDYALKKEAYDIAEKFFNIYRTNHGFEENVDSVKQAENEYSESAAVNFVTDTLELMYINWLCKSGKTRSYNFKEMNIDPRVLRYFSVFENVIINNTIDIVVDSSRYYDGMKPDCNNEPVTINPVTGTVKINYPGAKDRDKRRYFFNTLLDTIEKASQDKELVMDPETGKDILVQSICDNHLSNILYPNDFPLERSKNGIMYTGTNCDIINFDYEREQALIREAKEALQNIQAGV